MGQQATTADEVLDRYAAAHKTPPRLEATMSAQVDDSPIVAARLLLDGRQRALFRVSTPASTYTESIGPNMRREIETSQRLYDETPCLGIVTEESRLSTSAMFFPEWARIADLRQYVRGGKWELKGSELINGFGCDRLHVKTGDRSSGFEASVAVDQAGNLIHMNWKGWSPQGSATKNWTIKTLKMRSSFKPGEFDVAIPIGYMPFSVDTPAIDVSVGEQFPLAGWTDPRGNTVDLKTVTGSKPTLIAILGEECDASARALRWLQMLKSKLPLVFITDGAKPRLVADALTNPKGDLLNIIAYPATPFFAWIDGSGVVRALWMGFDPAKAAELERDILDKSRRAE